MLILDYWGLVPERDKIQFRTLGAQAVMAQGVLTALRTLRSGLHVRQMLQGKGFRMLATPRNCHSHTRDREF